MKKIFFVCYGGGHAKMIIPLVKALQANTSYKLVVLALTTAVSQFTDEGLDHFTMNSLASKIDTNWKFWGERLVSKNCISPLTSYDDSVAYYGINFLELVETYGYEKANLIFEEYDRQKFYPIRFFTNLLSELKPDLVVATNSPRSEKACIEAAGLLSIPSVCLVDMFALQEVNWIANNSFANKICVLNECVKHFFESHGRNSNDIFVTGNPAFDNINSEDVKTLAKKRLADDVNFKGKSVLFYASQPEPLIHPFTGTPGNPELPRTIEFFLREYVKNKDNLHLIIRYHPSEQVTFVDSLNVTLSPPSEKLHTLLHVADLVVVTASTVGLEAHLASTKVVSIDCSVFTNDAPFSKMGISDGVSSLSELSTYLDKFFENYEKSLSSQSLFNTKATDKILDVLFTLL